MPDDQCLEDKKSRLPIVLGVTGHRDLRDRASIRDLLEKQIADIIALYPSTPFAALSSLAEGADRIFAEIALKRNIPLYVPLPLPAEVYEADFPDTVDEFRCLCRRAKAVFTVPYVDGADAENTLQCSLERDLQYLQAGIYVAVRSHILFALWDGENARGPGGTAQIVNFRKNGSIYEAGIEAEHLVRIAKSTPISPLEEPDRGIIHHLLVARKGTSVQGETHQAKWITNSQNSTAEESDKWSGDADLKRIDSYNCEVGKRARVCSRPTSETSSTNITRYEADQLFARYEAADSLANDKVNNVRGQFKCVFLIAVGMVLTHEVYAEMWHNWFLLLLYLVLLGAVGWLVFFMRKARRNTEAVDLRALAEGLRIQKAWFLGGVHELVAQRYLRRDSRHMSWVRYALRGASLAFNAQPSHEDIAQVRETWIDEQRNYFEKSIDKREGYIRKFSKRSFWIFVLGIVITILALVVRRLDLLSEDHSYLLIAFDLLIGLLPAIAGLSSGYIEFMAYEDDLREHKRLKYLFDRASKRIVGGGLAAQQELIFQLGLEALYENANWALVHKIHDAKTPMS